MTKDKLLCLANQLINFLNNFGFNFDEPEFNQGAWDRSKILAYWIDSPVWWEGLIVIEYGENKTVSIYHGCWTLVTEDEEDYISKSSFDSVIEYLNNKKIQFGDIP